MPWEPPSGEFESLQIELDFAVFRRTYVGDLSHLTPNPNQPAQLAIRGLPAMPLSVRDGGAHTTECQDCVSDS
jgi:hypothetical protein